MSVPRGHEGSDTALIETDERPESRLAWSNYTGRRIEQLKASASEQLKL